MNEWFHTSGKKRVLSSSTKFELFFFSSIVAFCRHFCRLYARALVSKEEEERSPSFFFSLSLSHSFPRFAPPRRREKRRRPFERRRRKRRRRGVACFRFGERRYATPIVLSRSKKESRQRRLTPSLSKKKQLSLSVLTSSSSLCKKKESTKPLARDTLLVVPLFFFCGRRRSFELFSPQSQ